MVDQDWTHVVDVSDISTETNLMRVDAFGEGICLYRINEDIFATQDLCTHGAACLSEGWLEDGTIECPLHQGIFEVSSGKAMTAPATEDLKVYAVKIEDGKIYLKAAK